MRRNVRGLGLLRVMREAACLRLVFATSVKASESWHGVRMTPEILRALDQLRVQPTEQRERELVTV